MMIDLKAHYLDMIVQAIEAQGLAALQRLHSDDSGTIYAVKSDTSAEFVLKYGFGADSVVIGVIFGDGVRAPFSHTAHYVGGLDSFFPAFAKALQANRLAAPAEAGA